MEPTTQELIDAFKLILSKYEEAFDNKYSFDELIKNSLNRGICWYLSGIHVDEKIINDDIYSAINTLIKEDIYDGALYLFPIPNTCIGGIESIYKKCIAPRIEYLKEKINILELNTVI